MRLVQGSHIVVRKLYDHDRAYMFQNADGRIIFVIPYQDDFTLIGTTDRDYDGDPAKVKASPEEIQYLCASASEYLKKPVLPADVVWTYSGVRPLYDDGASEAKAATRDYVFELDTPGGAPLLSIYGGKITTYRRLAEEALERLSPYLRSAKAKEGWTGKSPLPGGDMDVSAVAALTAELTREYPFLDKAHANRLAHAYGTRATKLLGSAKSLADLGQSFGATLTESEVRYLMSNEWACTADDVAWRRSKLGLRLSPDEIAALDEWIKAHRAPGERPLREAGGRTVSVTLEHVTRTVDGIPTIRDVSLTLERGTLSVLLGPTLSGKTSIMRLLAGLDRPTTGRVLVDGKDVTGFDVRQRSVAMVYQQFINYPSLTVYENIASPLRVQGRPREEIDRRVQEAAKLLRLEPYLKRTPLQLSGGQQQRTAIARALVKGADLVLLDEPLANLDYKLREELRTELPRIFEASGAIFVYATTEPSEALAARRKYRLHVGRPGLAGRRHVKSLSPARYAAGGAGVLRSAAQYRRHREEERFCAICRRHPGAGHRPLCVARRRPLSRRLPRPSARSGQRHRRPPCVPRHRDGDRDHRFGKFRASQPRRLQLGRGAAGRA